MYVPGGRYGGRCMVSEGAVMVKGNKYKERMLGSYEAERSTRTREQLLELSRQYRDRAARAGVEFRIEYDKRYKLYTVSVVGECGYTVVPLRLLPTTLNGLFMAGRRVRGLYLSMKRSKKYDFPR